MSAEELLVKHEDDFELLYKLYADYNSHTNISAIRDEAEVYQKHFLDSLVLVPFIINELSDGDFRIIDMGTGGGFPALPLAIALKDKAPRITITAVDSVAKKTKFIELAKEELELDKLKIITARAEELAHQPEHREQYDLAVSRALANLPTLLEYLIPLVKTNHKVIALKSLDLDEEINDSSNALEILSARIIDRHIYDNDKQLLFIQKERDTDNKYPRRTGKPLKQPL